MGEQNKTGDEIERRLRTLVEPVAAFTAFIGLTLTIAGTVGWQEYLHLYSLDPGQFPIDAYDTIYFGAALVLDSWLKFLRATALALVGTTVVYFGLDAAEWMIAKILNCIRKTDEGTTVPPQREITRSTGERDRYSAIKVFLYLIALMFLLRIFIEIAVIKPGAATALFAQEEMEPSNKNKHTQANITMKKSAGGKSYEGHFVTGNSKFYAIYDYDLKRTRIIPTHDVEELTVSTVSKTQ
jgi:hypothetical protein